MDDQGMVTARGSGVFGALALLACSIGAAEARAQVVTGTVRDSTSGRPVVAATLALVAGRETVVSVAVTDDSGRYRLRAPAPGRYALASRRIGLLPRIDTLPALASTDTLVRGLTMTRIASALDTVRVTAKRGMFARVKGREFFEEHLRTSKSGYFVSAREIEWSGIPLSDYLGALPGFVRRPGLAGQSGVRSELGDLIQSSEGVNGCVRMRVDRVGMVTSIRDDQLRVQMRRYELKPSRTPLAYVTIRLSDIEAIEIFRDRQDIPEEWQMDAGRCTFVQIWTYKAW